MLSLGPWEVIETGLRTTTREERRGEVFPLHYITKRRLRMNEREEKRKETGTIEALRVNIKDIPDAMPMPKEGLKGGQLLTRIVYGVDLNLMVATREGGYHSRPHKHDAEQFNYVLSGKIWTFIGDEGFENVEGDFYRMPAGKVHWGWVRSSEPCTVIEAHCPPLLSSREVEEKAVGLFMEGEQQSLKTVENIFVDDLDTDAIERRVCGEAP
jgi:quercetin dioxygenase-like cupin family protein